MKKIFLIFVLLFTTLTTWGQKVHVDKTDGNGESAAFISQAEDGTITFKHKYYSVYNLELKDSIVLRQELGRILESVIESVLHQVSDKSVKIGLPTGNEAEQHYVSLNIDLEFLTSKSGAETKTAIEINGNAKNARGVFIKDNKSEITYNYSIPQKEISQ